MKYLNNILNKVKITKSYGNTDIWIDNLQFDHRKVVANSLFVAQKGTKTDGHIFINQAIKCGANTVICETLPKQLNKNICYIQVQDSQVALSAISSNFYNNPSTKLKLIGITGTNGKTTIATLLFQLFKELGYKAGLISTLAIKIKNKTYTTEHTTPNSVSINKYLYQMIEKEVSHCFMEVSSHGIHQKRTEGLYFSGGVFTNLSHEHLDYHKNFATYRDIKKSFFSSLPKSAFALSNTDDKNGLLMLQNTQAKRQTYALKTMADYKAKLVEKNFTGTLLNINGTEVWTQLIGQFNAYNFLAIYATAKLLGLNQITLLKTLSSLKSVSGRFQCAISKNNITAIVDYAHTPDALKNVLQTINDIRTGNENLITVIGCGGDRDKTKRPKMASIASQLSSHLVLTSDNPRTESPQAIIDDMKKGVPFENNNKTQSILNRKQAIEIAFNLLKPGDIILIAGKGHEDYQEINGKRIPFNDMQQIKQLFN
ncbi:MAG: UDP-N-acetylmuramoyl-L-alanyl-D-glutamate--2,6-diaminopimelate ligase [Tenacibaculum sp.]